MLASLKPSAGRRWPRGQRFQLTPSGLSAEAGYAEAVRDARAMGRAALDASQQRWAGALGIEPCDGVVLAQLKPGRVSVADLAEALADCGSTKAELKASVDRLVEKGLAEPVPPQTQALA